MSEQQPTFRRMPSLAALCARRDQLLQAAASHGLVLTVPENTAILATLETLRVSGDFEGPSDDFRSGSSAAVNDRLKLVP
jgi:hypothetical protein